MCLHEYRKGSPPPNLRLDLNINIPKEEKIGSYTHPALRRQQLFFFFNGQEFQRAVRKLYDQNALDVNLIIMVTRMFITKRLPQVTNVPFKIKVVNMYHHAIRNFNLMFCRDLYAIIQFSSDLCKFERLENFLSFVYDPSVRTVKEASSRAYKS